MDRQVDQNQIRPTPLETLNRFFPTMRGAVVDNPEYTLRGGIGLAAHDIPDQAVEGHNPGGGFAPPKELGAVHIPGSQIRERAGALVLMLDSHRLACTRWHDRVSARPCLNARLLIGAGHEVVTAERLAVPHTMVKIQYACAFGFELRITREDPATVVPRANCILRKPAPDSCAADCRCDSLPDHCARQITSAVARHDQESRR